MEKTSLVLGLGNPLQGADGFGQRVIECLRRSPQLPAGIELADAGTDLLAFVERFPEQECVVLVDAVVGGGGAGVGVVEEAVFSRWDERSPDCHAVSPLLAVKLFRRLYPESRTRIVLVGLSVSELGFGGPLAPEDVEAGRRAVLQLITAP